MTDPTRLSFSRRLRAAVAAALARLRPGPGLQLRPGERLYFAYGMNMEGGGMAGRCPTARPIGPARLPGFRLVFRGCADIAADPAGTVTGTLWAIRDRDERALDRLEGYPHGYGKRTVRVTGPGPLRSGATAMVYQMTHAGERGVFPPSPYYLALLRQGYRDFGIGDDAPLRAALTASTANPERAAALWAASAPEGEASAPIP